MTEGGNGLRRGPLIAVALIGVGLVLAPAVFQMFSRGPSGASMIDDFRPYMTVEKISEFEDYLAEIDAAVAETEGELIPDVVAAGALDEGDLATEHTLVAALLDEWPTIDDDMSDMLATMDDNRDNYAAVDALPSFSLFSWFFVIPGLLIVGLAVFGMVRSRKGRSTAAVRWLLVGMGVAVALAPVAFQMFDRAPLGGDMIDDFRGLMTRERVQNVQGYFVTLGAGEGQLRTTIVPLADDPAAYPAVAQFNDDWPTITGDFAPMIGTMSDNVDNFADVDALPPFDLFPWFFVIPGVLVAGLAFLAGRGAGAATDSDRPAPSPPAHSPDDQDQDPKPEDPKKEERSLS